MEPGTALPVLLVLETGLGTGESTQQRVLFKDGSAFVEVNAVQPFLIAAYPTASNFSRQKNAAVPVYAKWFDFLKAARTTTVVFDERLYVQVDSLLVEAKKHGAITSLVTELMTFGDKCAAMIAAGPAPSISSSSSSSSSSGGGGGSPSKGRKDSGKAESSSRSSRCDMLLNLCQMLLLLLHRQVLLLQHLLHCE